MKHASGCNIWTANALTRWYHNNPWILVVIQMTLGLLIAFKGRAIFPTVITLLTFFLVSKYSLLIVSIMEICGDGPWSNILHHVLAFVIGTIVALIVRKSIWVLVGIAGILSGFALGQLTFAVAVKAAGSGAI